MSENKWERLNNPPAPLFYGKKERDLVKKVNEEMIERVQPHRIIYYAIDQENTNYDELYGEAIKKTFLSPIVVAAVVEWEGLETQTDSFGPEQSSNITVNFHKKRLTEDQNLFVRVGDFVGYGDNYYEITSLQEPRLLFGQVDHKFDIIAICRRARRDLFEGI